MKKQIINKYLVFGLILIFTISTVSSAFGSSIYENLNKTSSVTDEYPLPPPTNVDMNLEESIFRRMSVRGFTDESISDEDLSTVLWAAHGYSNEKRTIPGLNGAYAGIIYVLKEDAAYKYNPENHSLVHFKDGDYREIVGWQYEAPIQLGLCWNTDLTDAYYGGAELGMMGQNIYFMANALNLGTVVCGQYPPAIDPLDIPENEEGLVVMPLGHPNKTYNFKDRPIWISLLPKIQHSEMSISTALSERNDGETYTGEISREQLSQFLWSSYGFSPYLDRSDQYLNPVKRHRTVPSAHGYYPFHIYAVTENGIYKYEPSLLTRLRIVPADLIGFPIVTFLMKIKTGDHREELAQATNDPTIASAPLIIINVLDVEMTRPEGLDDLSAEIFKRFWTYEAGASAYNIMIEATAWDYTSNIYLPTDEDTLRTLLKLEEECLPIFIVPIGENT